jgi:lipopolysaccharide exporter
MSEELAANDGTRAAAGRGALVVLSLQIVVQLLAVLRIALVSRALGPLEFGVFGVALLLIGLLETFSDPGIQSALVQRQQETRHLEGAAWTLSFLRSLLLGVLMFLLAHPIASFFHSPRSVPLVQLLAGIVALRGFTSLGPVLNTKRLAFGRNAFLTFAGPATELVISVYLAQRLRTADALMWGFAANNLVTLGLSYLVHPFRPRIDLRFGHLRELLGFSRWVSANRALFYTLQNIDDFIVGRVLGTPALGLYQVAYRFSNLPATQLSGALFKVAFPLYSRLQAEPARLAQAYGTVFRYMAVLIVPATAMMVGFAPDFVRIVLGPQWAATAVLMQILAIYGMARALTATAGPLVLAIGRPDIQTRHAAVALVVMLAIFIPATLYGDLVIASWSLSAFSVGVAIAFFLEIGRRVPIAWPGIGRAFLIASAGGTAALSVAVVGHRLLPAPTLGTSLALVVAAGSAALLTLFLVDRWMGGHLLRDARATLRSVVRLAPSAAPTPGPPEPNLTEGADFEFTGEQAVQGGTPERIMQDHNARYAFALRFVRGKTVLDVACGTGYGTRRLAQAGAAHVTGIDVSEEAVDFARRSHSAPNVAFRVGDVTRLDVASESMDVVVSFETIEHVEDDRRVVEELHRVLRPDGLLLLSTPNRPVTSPLKGIEEAPNNRHHVREYDRRQLEALIAPRFRIRRRLGQRQRPGVLFSPTWHPRLKARWPNWFRPELGDPTPRGLRLGMAPRYFVYVLRRR